MFLARKINPGASNVQESSFLFLQYKFIYL